MSSSIHTQTNDVSSLAQLHLPSNDSQRFSVADNADKNIKKTASSSNSPAATTDKSSNIQTPAQVQHLVDNLNKTIGPLSTSIKFGVDSHDVFYVSVIDTKTDKVISRYPAEKAAEVLPKAKAFVGVLFDTKG